MHYKLRADAHIDLASWLEDVGKTVLYNTALGVRDFWASEAQKTLRSTANDYVESLRVSFSMGATLSAEVYLEGTWAKKLELGYSSYDMKPFFARSDKKKRAKNGGWYMDVPFRHTTPAATGRNGMPMPSSVYARARNLPPGGRLPNTMGNFGGMKRVKESNTSSRSAYMTWRRVSDNSSPDSFIHPGYKGANVMDKVQGGIDDIFMRVMQSSLPDSSEG